MTREEKIAELINIRDNFNYTLAPREVFDDAIKALAQESTVEAIPKADYEKRLKADMVGILTYIQSEIDTMSDSVVEGRTVTITSWRGMQKRICNMIQSKIDKLKEN